MVSSRTAAANHLPLTAIHRLSDRSDGGDKLTIFLLCYANFTALKSAVSAAFGRCAESENWTKTLAVIFHLPVHDPINFRV